MSQACKASTFLTAVSPALKLIADSRAFCVSSREEVGDGKLTLSYLPQPGDGREKAAVGGHFRLPLCRLSWGPVSGIQIAGCCLLIHVLAGLWATKSPSPCTALSFGFQAPRCLR